MKNIPLLELKGVTKDFNGTVVLKDVSFSLHKGEILGLVGENGAGKTTLMSILFGMPLINETGGFGGAILLNGEQVVFKTPLDALDAGIGMVHQEFSLIPGFTTTENILLNKEITKLNPMIYLFGDRMRVLDRKKMHESAEESLKKLGISIDLDMKISKMPVGHKQFTEIAREINRENVQILVLDEPTAVLTESEAEILLQSVKKLASQGIAIIFISHRLHEITQICDRVVTLRDGKSIRDIPTNQTNVRDIAASMVGKTLDSLAKKPIKQAQPHTNEEDSSHNTILKIEHLWVDMPGETVRDVNLEIKKGEIFGIGGLAGQGKIGIPNGVMGLYPAGGKVIYKGTEIELNNPKYALNSGLSFVSEDRRGVGLLLNETLEWNIAFTAMQTSGMFLHTFLGGLIRLRDEKAMKKVAQKYIEMLEIKCTGTKQKAQELSGGNQQKVCLAKAFCVEPELLFVSEPTRGIDVGAKAIVLDVLRAYNREKGTTIIMVSSELEELRSICNRIAVVFDGKIANILTADDDPAEFAIYMSGLQDEEMQTSPAS